MKRSLFVLAALLVPAFAVAQTVPADMPVYRGVHATPVLCVDQSGAYVSCGGTGTTGTASNAADAQATSTSNASTISFPFLYNGSTFDRWRGDTTNGGWVNVKASVLPTGAATAANQTTGNTSLASIDSKTPASPATAGNQTTGNTSLASIDTKLPAQVSGRVPVDGSGVTQPVSMATNTPAAAVSAATGGIASASYLASAAASTNATSVKASAGRLYKVCGYNAASALRYLKLYNKASAPTVGTDTPLIRRPLPPGGFCFDWMDIGAYFATGIAYALTTGNADTDTGALTAADVVALSLEYN